METKIKEKIEKFYMPEVDMEKRQLSMMHPIDGKKYVSIFKKRIYLGFEDVARNEKEAKEKGMLCISGEEIYSVFAPQLLSVDTRMEEWLKAEKQKIGLLEYGGGSDSSGQDFQKFKKEYEIEGYAINLTGSGNVDVGKNEKGEWIAEYTYRSGIDDFDIVFFIFFKKPDINTIKEAETLIKIENLYVRKKYSAQKMEIRNCWECGTGNIHFLDLTHSLGGELINEERLENFEEGYCGC